MQLIFDTDGYATLLDGADPVHGGISLSDADGALVRSAMSQGNIVRRSGDGFVILPAPATAPRETTALSKIDFCRALYAAKILPADLVVDAALGKWPSTFEAAIAGLPEPARVDAKLAWAGATHVSRTAPLFLQLLAFFGQAQQLSKKQIEALGDQIFGVTP